MATAAERLVEAEAAYHALSTGQSVARVRDASGDEVVYRSSNLSDLRRYIAELRAEIAGTSPVNKPLRPVFNL